MVFEVMESFKMKANQHSLDLTIGELYVCYILFFRYNKINATDYSFYAP